MKLSVIMSVYNGETFLNTSIESILNQSFENFEFIIIDDCSIDNSLEIIKTYAKKDKRIKILRNYTNIGLTKSLNKALKCCKGRFIARQDVDDISLPQRFAEQLAFLEKNPNYAFCGTNGLKKYDNQELVNQFEYKEIRKNLIFWNCFHHTSIMIRKKILEKYGYYDEKLFYSQDFELWCRLIYKFKLKAKNLPEILIIREKQVERFKKKNRKKFLIQRFNGIKITLKYRRYTRYKLKIFLFVLLSLIEILTRYSIIQFFWKFLDKIDF